MRILLIEDQERIANFIERGLKEQKFAIDVAKDGEEGLYFIDINTYDLVNAEKVVISEGSVSKIEALLN